MSISDAYRRSPHAVRLSRSFTAPMSPSAVGATSPSTGTPSRPMAAPPVLARRQEWRSWGLLLAVVAVLVVAAGIRASGSAETSSSSSSMEGGTLLDEAALAERLRTLQERVLAQALTQAEAGDAAVADRVERLASERQGLDARLAALEALLKQLASDVQRVADGLAQTEQQSSALQASVGGLASAEALRDLSARLDAANARVLALEQSSSTTTTPPPAAAAPGLSKKELEDALRAMRAEISAVQASAVPRPEVQALAASAVRSDITTAVEAAQRALEGTAQALRSEMQAAAGLKRQDVAAMLEQSVEALVERAVHKLGGDGASTADPASVEQVVRRLLEVERADHFGRRDYAADAVVLPDLTSETLLDKQPWYVSWLSRGSQEHVQRVLGVQLPIPVGPDSVLGPGARRACWRFAAGGNLTVALRVPVAVDAVVVEHAKKAIAWDATMAPRAFDVYAYPNGLHAEPTLAGSFEYDLDAPEAIQLFRVPSSVGKTQAVRFHFRSSHGSPSICLFRVRVFGKRDDE